MPAMKTCTKCQVAKPETEFWQDRRRGGVLPHCKRCKADAAKLWRDTNPNKARERYWSNPQGERERHLIRKYGVDQREYDRMFLSQDGACAVCLKRQDRAFDVDHDHATGAVRGLLCTSCNRMIGHAGDRPEVLDAAAIYLRGQTIVPQVAAEVIGAWMEVSLERKD